MMCKMKHLHSFVLGIWIKHGSRYEKPEKNGISHFIEHLFFQGTKKLDAKAISFEIDSLGGDINAFTTREFTVLYIKVLDKCIKRGVELLGEIYSNPLFPEQEIEKERAVILDEIRTINDTPDELIHDLFMEKAFPNGLGKPILGKESSLISITRKDIIECYNSYYSSDNCIISCAGNFDEKELVEYLEKNIVFRKSNKTIKCGNSKFSPSINVYEKDLNEVHLSLGFDTFPFNSPYRYPLTLLNCIIGGTVSSRLFQEIREKRGLVYNIYSYVSFYRDIGLFDIYTACDSRKINKILELTLKIIKNIPDTIKNEELQRAKTQTISQILFSSESPGSVMHNLAYQELYLNKYHDFNKQIKEIETVTLDEIKEVARMFSEKIPSITILGPLKREDINF